MTLVLSMPPKCKSKATDGSQPPADDAAPPHAKQLREEQLFDTEATPLTGKTLLGGNSLLPLT